MALELTVIEKTELEELETVIKQDMGAYYRVGCALAKIRDSRLYRETHSTFEAYCKDRWEMKRAHAYRLIESASVKDHLSPMGDIQPINERQARPLTKLATAEAQREAWETVVETAPEGKITAYHVSKVVNGKLKIHIIDNVNKMKHEIKKIRKEHIVNEEVRKAYDAFYWQVQNAKLEKWAHTSKQACLQMVEWINDLIEI